MRTTTVVMSIISERGFVIKEKKRINRYWSKYYYGLSEKGERFLAYLGVKTVV